MGDAAVESVSVFWGTVQQTVTRNQPRIITDHPASIAGCDPLRDRALANFISGGYRRLNPRLLQL